MSFPCLLCMILIMCITKTQAACHRHCNGHGYCSEYQHCICNRGLDGEAAFIGADCSLRTCPKGLAWMGNVVKANDVHPMVECSNKGLCDRISGVCMCYTNYEGLACERTVCPNDCSGRGECYAARQLADEAGATYVTPWDSSKHVGCVCDAGYRGVSCNMVECPSGADTLKGFGNEAGRDCSGRGICDYSNGNCRCFAGYYGVRCELQTTFLTFS